MPATVAIPDGAVAKSVDFAVLGARKWQQSHAEPRAMWVTIFRMAMVRREQFASRMIMMDLGDSIAFLFWGRVEYMDGSEAPFELGSDYNLTMDGSKIRHRESLEGGWLAITTPIELDGSPRNEGVARRNVQTAVALMSALHNDNIAFSLLTENEYEFEGGKLACYSPVFRSPHSLPAPNLAVHALGHTEAAALHVTGTSDPQHNRRALALRWYRASLESDGIDAILKAWVAIEVLAMTSTDIGPICDALAKIYGITSEAAKSRFMIGKYFGLRSNIVHAGAAPAIDSALTGFLERIFIDLLRYELQAPAVSAALQFLDMHESALRAAMTKALAA